MSAVLDPTTTPPEGVRLQIGSTATDLRISIRDMAEAVGVSPGAMCEIVVHNRWPVRTPRAEIEQRLRALCEQRGATAEQLATLFRQHQRTARGKAPGRDYYDRPVDEQGNRIKPPRQEKETDVLLAKQTLSPAARKAFELFTNPFDGEVQSAEEMFQSGEIRFVREACWQAARNARFVAVVGESGAGKTTLLADLKERIAVERTNTTVIEPSVLGMEDSDTSGKTLKSADILTAIVLTIDPTASVALTMERRSRQAERMLADSTKAGNEHLLLIEEAHALPIATLKHLKRLHERMRLNGRKPMLGILLLGQPELRAKLDERRHDVREVVQRVELVELQALGNDLRAYLAHRAKQAGRELAQLIDDGGIDAIRERLTVLRPGVRNAPVSLLYPLAVNNAMTACLNAAAEIGAPLVTRDVVRAI